jgi:NADP-dependent 3-hydroxy acid dehydrogenase YdfG
MARILIVGCGCRGRELARGLIAAGHAVRGTTRREDRLAAIEAAGAEAVLVDPDRLSTLLPHLQGAAVLVWLMGTAAGDAAAVAALHGERLESALETLVDTHVRGAVYEAAGTVAPGAFERGAAIARRVAATYRMPVEPIEAPPAEPGRWLAAALRAVDSVLSA